MIEWIVPLTDAVVAALLLSIGGNLGSFLNVVVHRLPRGESVVHGSSHCPACGATIRWHDNVPVVGWLLLGGRCRDCRAPIAARYPLLELAGAVLIGGVAAVELLSGGATIPGKGLAGVRAGADNLLLRPDPLLIGFAVFHAWLLFDLLLEGAVEADGRIVPRRWQRTALGLTIAAVAACPPLLPVAIWPGLDAPAHTLEQRPWEWGAAASACGAAAGWIAGRAIAPTFPAPLALVGAALGWQAMIAILCLLPVVRLIRVSLGSLMPSEPPGTTRFAGSGVALPEEGPPTEAECGGAGQPSHASMAEIETSGTDDGPESASPPGGGPGASLAARLSTPAGGFLRIPTLVVGDVVLATALLLLAWRTLTRLAGG